MSTHFIILAAGLGSRLGGSVPKPLTELEDGRTILQQQLSNITSVFGEEALSRTTVVVGHRADELRAVLPGSVSTVTNRHYRTTNTSKSLLLGLASLPSGSSALWLNGDVVFDAEILRKALPLIEAESSFVVVNEGRTAEEEIKYRLDELGLISEISKTVRGGIGEAVGINHVSTDSMLRFCLALESVELSDYFEAAMERTIQEGMGWIPLSAGSSYAVEVDFPEDLERANSARSSL